MAATDKGLAASASRPQVLKLPSGPLQASQQHAAAGHLVAPPLVSAVNITTQTTRTRSPTFTNPILLEVRQLRLHPSPSSDDRICSFYLHSMSLSLPDSSCRATLEASLAVSPLTDLQVRWSCCRHGVVRLVYPHLARSLTVSVCGFFNSIDSSQCTMQPARGGLEGSNRIDEGQLSCAHLVHSTECW